MTIGHAGGWDEILYFLAPVVLYLVFNEIRRRRKERRIATITDNEPPSGGTS